MRGAAPTGGRGAIPFCVTHNSARAAASAPPQHRRGARSTPCATLAAASSSCAAHLLQPVPCPPCVRAVLPSCCSWGAKFAAIRGSFLLLRTLPRLGALARAAAARAPAWRPCPCPAVAAGIFVSSTTDRVMFLGQLRPHGAQIREVRRLLVRCLGHDKLFPVRVLVLAHRTQLRSRPSCATAASARESRAAQRCRLVRDELS